MLDIEESRVEGIIDDDYLFDLDSVTDKELLDIVRKQIPASESYWNNKKGFNLAETQKQNTNLWLGKHYEGIELYDHQVPYMDNRIFTDVETVVASVTARVPQPEVYPSQDTTTSKQLAKDLEATLVRYTEKNRVMSVHVKVAVRHMLLSRIGWIKLRWDESKGKNGDIVTEFVLPEDIVVDKNAKYGQEPMFIAQWLECSLDELVTKFSNAKDKIYSELGIQRGVKTQLQKLVRYKEIWFTYLKDGAKKEGVAWTFNDTIVLGKMKNPNWNYSKSSEFQRNYLDNPAKPYIPFNYLNLGRHYIDDISLVEQAKIPQDILNKRGRQIVENADSTNGGWVFSSKALSKDDAAELTGASDEKIVVDADDVRTAVSRIPMDALPNYVLEDKFDARNVIDNVFATHNVTRGEESGSNTLGQDVLQKNQDLGRQDDIVRAIDDAMDMYYQYLCQMFKVFYTDEHWFKITGEDGQFDSVVMKSDNIEDGIEIQVKSGTTLPVDKASMRATALKLAELQAIDPLTLYEDLYLPNPQKRFDRLIQWISDPASFTQGTKGEELDREAFMDIQILNAGVAAKPRDDITEQHMNYHRKYIMGGQYRKLKDNVKQLHIDHMALETEELRRTLMLEETQLPIAEETELANQTTDQQMQAQMIEQNAQAGGQAPQPGAKPMPSGGNMPRGIDQIQGENPTQIPEAMI